MKAGPWTRHGHTIDGVTVSGPGGPEICRCGGPSLCQACKDDAEKLTRIKSLFEEHYPSVAPSIRSKFRVDAIQSSKAGCNVKLSPFIPPADQPDHENATFFKFTPWGHIELGLLNADTAAAFTVGQDFYVDFTPARARTRIAPSG